MKAQALKFVSEIAKPWELLNHGLSKPLAVSPTINDFITQATGLAVAIKHFPESTNGIKAKALLSESTEYEIISDLADSLKHGTLGKPERQCSLSISSMYERNDEAKFRFIRNRITITHNTYGKKDFILCSMASALFVSQRTMLPIRWNPTVLNNGGDFTNHIKLHISKANQPFWTGMGWETVRLNPNGEYENVEMNATVLFELTMDA